MKYCSINLARKHYTKCDKLVTKDHFLHDVTCIYNPETRHNQKAHFNCISIFKLKRCSSTILEMQSSNLSKNLKHGKMTKSACVNLRQCLLVHFHRFKSLSIRK